MRLGAHWFVYEDRRQVIIIATDAYDAMRVALQGGSRVEEYIFQGYVEFSKDAVSIIKDGFQKLEEMANDR